MLNYEESMGFEIPEGVALGDIPNIEGLNNPEVASSLSKIGEAIHRADEDGASLYGVENWSLINGR